MGRSQLFCETDLEGLSACPVCDSPCYRSFSEPDVCKCGSCKTLFRNPRPTQESVRRSYNDGCTYDAWHQEANAEHWDNLWEHRLQFVKRFKSSGLHLDIGAGDGTFLSKTKEAGFSVIGSELSETAASFMRKSSIDVILGQFTEVRLPSEKYDLITLWHVLEHVPNPGAVMDRIRKVIDPEGVLVVAVPNEDNPIWLNRLMPWNYPAAFKPFASGAEIHLTHFQPSTLKRLLWTHGFHIVHFGVDDSYKERNFLNRLKHCSYEALARLAGWHPAVSMLAVARPYRGILSASNEDYDRHRPAIPESN